MWDTVQTNQVHLSHDLPCLQCGHAVHTYLACSDSCACAPVVMPGSAGPRRRLTRSKSRPRPRGSLPPGLDRGQPVEGHQDDTFRLA
jgi:hypothetical protein